MLNFDLNPYVFTAAGKEYELPRFDFERFERVFDILKIESPAEQSVAFRDLVLSGASSETVKVLKQLQPHEITELFRDWSQMGPQKKTDVPLGEDSSSTN